MLVWNVEPLPSSLCHSCYLKRKCALSPAVWRTPGSMAPTRRRLCLLACGSFFPAAAASGGAAGRVANGASASAAISLDVDWTQFLSQHDLLWDWTWGSGGESVIRPRTSSLEYCGDGGVRGDCCVGVRPASQSLELQACDDQASGGQTFVQQPDGSVLSTATGLCLTSVTNNAVKLQACMAGDEKQTWSDQDGFFTLGAPPAPPSAAKEGWHGRNNKSHLSATPNDPQQTCLQVSTNTPFCNGTICPVASAQNFTAGAELVTAGCHNGDRSQFFAVQAKGGVGGKAVGENLVPLTWVRRRRKEQVVVLVCESVHASLVGYCNSVRRPVWEVSPLCRVPTPSCVGATAG